ncbi:MAG: hypothetical protein ACXWDO_06310 [Bacteroidia bacterium]
MTKYPGGIYLLQIQTQNAQHTVRLIKN